ncbi:MAG: hypothetical protein ABSC06_20205 [Rhodopila sp.]|jgi:hypothetical protein
MPLPPCLLPHTPDPAVERWRLRIGIAGIVLTILYLVLLPLFAS